MALTLLEAELRKVRRSMHVGAVLVGAAAGYSLASGNIVGAVATFAAFLAAERFRSLFEEAALNTAALLRRVSR